MTKENRGTLAAFATYVTSNILGMIGLSCYILADTFFVARGCGAAGLTALNLALPAYSLMHRPRPDDGDGRRNPLCHRAGGGPDRQAECLFSRPLPFGLDVGALSGRRFTAPHLSPPCSEPTGR